MITALTIGILAVAFVFTFCLLADAHGRLDDLQERFEGAFDAVGDLNEQIDELNDEIDFLQVWLNEEMDSKAECRKELNAMISSVFQDRFMRGEISVYE